MEGGGWYYSRWAVLSHPPFLRACPARVGCAARWPISRIVYEGAAKYLCPRALRGRFVALPGGCDTEGGLMLYWEKPCRCVKIHVPLTFSSSGSRDFDQEVQRDELG